MHNKELADSGRDAMVKESSPRKSERLSFTLLALLALPVPVPSRRVWRRYLEQKLQRCNSTWNSRAGYFTNRCR